MYAFGVLQSHILILIRLVDPLGLSIVDNLLYFCGVDLLALLVTNNRIFVGQAELKHTLLACNLATIVPVLLELDEEPLDDLDESSVVTA